MPHISAAEYRRIMGVKKTHRAVDVGDHARWVSQMEKGGGIFIPLRTHTPGNGRRHWFADAREVKQQRTNVATALLQHRQGLPKFPVKVKFTRYGPGRMDRHNLPGALKAVVDAVAKFYGVDDGDDRWQFSFEKERSKYHGVRIEITAIG